MDQNSHLMNNIGVHIATQQNQNESIAMLASQRYLYAKAKTWFYLQIIIVTIVPVILSIYSLIFKKTAEEYLWIFVTYTVSASVLEIVLDNIVDSLKKKAAAIQELFDTSVLVIPWNAVEITTKPSNGSIFRYLAKEKKRKDISKLLDWYSPVIATIRTNIATVICQRTNCTYDFTLRKRISFYLNFSAITLFAILLLIWMANGGLITQFFIQVLAPSAPLFILVIRQLQKNKEAITNLNDLKTLIDSQLENASQRTVVSEEMIRSIQNKIYRNRILSPLLPDRIFEKWRSNLEAEMHYDVTILVNKLKP